MKKGPIKTLSVAIMAGLVLFLCAGNVYGADPVSPAEVNTELKVIHEALLKGPSEETRIDAAVVLLGKGQGPERQILMQILSEKENTAAHQAICRALIKTRSQEDAVPHREDFLKPLMYLIINSKEPEARLAAESLLIYDYSQVRAQLRGMATDKKLTPASRINVIYALRFWPVLDSISLLGSLMDDEDPEVSAAAEKALRENFGIDESADKQTIKDMLWEIQHKPPMEIIRDLIVVQRTKQAQQTKAINQLTEERELWKNKYLEELDKDFSASDQAGRTKMLLEKFSGKLPDEKIWALGKVSSFSMAISPDVRLAILKCVTDEARSVRLTAAKVLSSKSALDPAGVLLAQLKSEKDSEVKMAIFNALGEACFFAFSPGSPVKVEESIRDETLNIAAAYLQSQDQQQVVAGAEVLRKLLELNGLKPGQADEYLVLLSQRYQKAKESGNPALRGRLLGEMARLCGKSSYKAKAVELFGKEFTDSLGDSETLVKESAALGIMNVDKSQAFDLFRKNGLWKDPSPAIKRYFLSLAGDYGGQEELGILIDMARSNGQVEPAWNAVMSILKRQESQVVFSWADKVPSSDQSDRTRSVLELAETKAQAEGNTALLAQIRSALLKKHLQADRIPAASGIFARHLIENKDIDLNDLLVKDIDSYLKAETTGSELKVSLLAGLAAIKLPEGQDSPVWSQVLKEWQNSYLPRSQPQPVKPVETTAQNTDDQGLIK